MGEVDLFFHAAVELSPAETSLLDALAAHLASALENLRLDALEKETAIARERTFIARELHDSIAQSLAFLKIQVQLMRDALDARDTGRVGSVLAEIDEGVRECYGDVRELLVHFRTRAAHSDLETAIEKTLHQLESQTGIHTQFTRSGAALPLSPEAEVQALHIVQEALSNVRKHADARHVSVDMERGPMFRFRIRDDGRGFDADAEAPATHVGLRIMRERTQRIGGTLSVKSRPKAGTEVVLELAVVEPESMAA